MKVEVGQSFLTTTEEVAATVSGRGSTDLLWRTLTQALLVRR